MTNPRLSRLATDLLRDESRAVEAPYAGEEARAIAAIERALDASRRRQRTKRAMIGAGVAIAAGICLLVGWRLHAPAASSTVARAMPATSGGEVAARGHALSDGVVLLRDGRELSLDAGSALEPNDRVVTSATGQMSISLATGTQLVVGASSDFAIVEHGRTAAFSLKAGSMRADVAKLRAGERFVVRTLDGEVEVRGTSFQVEVVPPSPTCGGGTTTRVVVTEGVVVVRGPGGEDSVRRGESWPRNCTAAAVTVETKATGTPTPLATASTVAGAPAVVSPAASSDLAAQNALFAEASAARRRGDQASAVAAYERLAARYPTSPLAESASVERMRLLAASDSRRGADAARLYLARYPRGFARAEATDLAAKAP